MGKKALFNLLTVVLLCLQVNISSAKHVDYNSKEAKVFATITVDSKTDESCPGSNDGSITYSISGINGSTITVVLGVGSSTVVETMDFNSITGGTVTGTFNNLAPNSHYFIQFLTNTSETGSLSPISIAAGDLAVQVSATSPGCNGDSDGTISLAGAGGTGPYSYSVDGTRLQSNNIFTALSAGNYTIIIEDALGCQVQSTYQLTEPDAVTASLTSTDISCNGASNGSISIQAAGGNGVYQYSIDGGNNFQNSASFSGLMADTYTIITKDGNNCSVSESTTITAPDPLVIAANSVTDVSCNGADDGSISLNITGGTTPYASASLSSAGGSQTVTLPANNTLTGLEPGSYQLLVRDASFCSSNSISFTISEPDPLVIQFVSGSNNVCEGETTSLTVTATGGATPYSYSINGGDNFQSSATFTGLPGGNTYTFTTMDANGCIATSTAYSITELPPVTGTIAATDITCFGADDGTITVSGTAGGASFGYEYSIDGTNYQSGDIFTGLSPGNYTVHIRDGFSCSTALTTSISEPSEITGIANVLSDVSCGGGSDGSVEINMNNTISPVTYTLDNGTPQTSSFFTGLSAGNHTVAVSSGPQNCSTTLTFSITEPSPVVVTAIEGNITCNGSNDGNVSLAASGGAGNYTYSVTGGNNYAGSGVSPVFVGLSPGSYTAMATDANGCSGTMSFVITEPAAIQASFSATSPSCLGTSDGTITLTNATGGTGNLTYRIRGMGSFQSSGNFTGLATGTYTIEIQDANGCQSSENITISDPSPITAIVTIDSNASGCGNTDGAFTISNPANGNGSYTYSIDGSNFQPSGNFTGLSAGIYTVTIQDGTSCTGTVTATITEPSGITASINAFGLSCNGDTHGIVTVSGTTGGMSPYEYSIGGTTFSANSTFTGLSGGSYLITIRDASGCTEILSADVTEPSAITAIASITDIACNGELSGEIIITASGGTGSLTYSIDGNSFQTSPSFTALRAGSYTVTVKDDNDCSITVHASIAEPTAISASISATTDITCHGESDGTATISISGGTAPYEVSTDGMQFFPVPPNGVFTNIGAVEIPTIQVRDANNCTISINGFTISEPDPLELDLNVSDVSCKGDSDGQIAVTASSDNNGTFEYSIDGSNFQSGHTFSQLAPGSYTITVRETGLGCTQTAQATVAEPDVLSASAITTDISCKDASDGTITINTTGGTAPYEYSLDGTNFQTTPFSNLAAASYNITIRDANDCTTTTMATITEPTALTATFTTTNVVCAGEASGSITLTIQGGTAPYTWTDALTSGNTLSNINGNSGTFDAAAGTRSGNATVTDVNGCTLDINFTINEPTAVTGTVATTNVTCHGGTDGSITVTASGGTGIYSYAIDGTNFSPSNSFTGLVAGSYTITIADESGCTGTLTQTIAEPTALSLNFEAAHVTCYGDNDGQIAGFTTGGTAPYQYSLDGSTFQSAAFTNLTPGSYTLTVMDANGCTDNTLVTIAGPDLLQTNVINISQVTCKGADDGSATVNVTGGSAPYTYSLDGTSFNTSIDLTNLSAGNYIVTVRDNNGCESTTDFTITEPNALGATATTSSLLCHGDSDGNLTVITNGGTAPYEYSLDGNTFQNSSTFTGLSGGNYTVTIRDANGCSTTAAVSVTQPAVITVSSNITDAACNGDASGIIDIVALGGSGSLEYSLDGANFQTGSSFSGLLAGTYTISVRDSNGCSMTTSSTVSEPTAITASATITDLTCNGDGSGEIDVTASGGTGLLEYSLDGTNFQAAKVFTGLSAGNYTITIMDTNGCTSAITATVVEPPGLLVSAGISNDNTILATATGGTSPYEYSLNSGTFQSSGNFSGLANGDYSITVRDANGCTATTSGSLVVTSLEPTAEPAEIHVYPNPVTDYLSLSTVSQGDEISIMTLNGTVLQNSKALRPSSDFKVDISQLTEGMFLIMVNDKYGQRVLLQKFIKMD